MQANHPAHQTTVDAGREFNQVREHDHREGHTCWCGQVGDDVFTPDLSADSAGTREQYSRHVSPSILEHRIQLLSKDLEAERREHIATKRELRNAERQIGEFEQFSRGLAERIDAMESDFIFMTGKGMAEWLADAKAESVPQPAETASTPADYLGLDEAEPKAAA